MTPAAALPDHLVILGIPYRLVPCDDPVQADVYRRYPVFGQVDFASRTVRVYVGDRPAQDVLRTVLHESLHAIMEQLHLPDPDDGDDRLDCLALALVNLLQQNPWLVDLAAEYA